MKRIIALLLVLVMFILPVFSSIAEGDDNEVDANKLGSAQLKGREEYGSLLPFTDVPYTRWDYAAIAFGYNNKYINGTSETTFSPTMKITRGQFVTLLGGMEKIDKTKYTAKVFPDVKEGVYYTANVNWASSVGLVNGYSDGRFGPDDPITREQLATLMFRYAKYKNTDTSDTDESGLNAFSDKSSISNYARSSAAWCVNVGVINGSGGKILPLNSATRAEAAQMLYKLVDNVIRTGADISKVTLSKAITDNMVVQRCEIINVWGFADDSEEGKYVHASLLGATGSAEIIDGEWKITLNKSLPANDSLGNDLVVWGSDSGDTLERKDILVGDVYLIAGQSNVHFSIRSYEIEKGSSNPNANKSIEAFEKVKYDKDAPIRMLRVSMLDWMYGDKTYYGVYGKTNATPCPDVANSRGWQKPLDTFTNDPYFDSGIEYLVTAAKSFSAVGYVYATKLLEKTGVPIGMIEIDASGLDLAAFMPNELCEKFDSRGFYFDSPCYVDPVTTMPTRFVYNQQIYSVRNFSLAGLIWYQGESDWRNTYFTYGFNDTYPFVDRFVDLMNYLREDFANGDWPVYIEELAPCYLNDSNVFINFSVTKSEMGMIPNLLDNCYISASSDLWYDMVYWNAIHPYCKYDQGSRIADIAYATNYVTDEDVEYKLTPQLRNVTYNDNQAVLTFDYVGDGLTYDKESGEFIGFEVCVDPDSANWDKMRGVFGYPDVNRDAWKNVEGYQIEVTSNNQLTITFDSKIYGVRYNAIYDGAVGYNISLVTKNGLPANAFADYSSECYG